MNKDRVVALCSREARDQIRKLAKVKGQLLEYCLNEIINEKYKRVFKDEIKSEELKKDNNNDK